MFQALLWVLGIQEGIKKIPAGWEMGVRIVSYKYSCQEPNSIDLIRSLGKKGHCQRGRYTRR